MELTNRMIAEAAGWRVESINTWDTWDIDYGGWRLIAGDKVIGLGKNIADEEAAWARVAYLGKLPDYIGDANAALSLIDFMGFQMFWEDGKWGVFVGIEGWPDFWHENPALVICRAWYKEQEAAREAEHGA